MHFQRISQLASVTLPMADAGKSGKLPEMRSRDEREAELRERYGDLLTLSDLAAVLRYPSLGALKKARSRGLLPLTLVQMPPRREWFATTEAVAALLCRLEAASQDDAAAGASQKQSRPS
jgi:hypothetical protein